jgi:hypothetical protein
MIRIELGSPIDSDTLRSELPDGVVVEDAGLQYFEFDISGFSLFVFTLGWAASIPANIIASAIYDAIKKRSKEPPTRILIDKRQVEFDRGKITRVIHERVEIHQKRPPDEHK